MEEKKELISQSGYDEVKAELEYLNNVKMPEISVKISEAREQYLQSFAKRLLYLMALPGCLDFRLQPNTAPADTPMPPSNVMSFSMRTSMTPAVNMPRIAPPSKTIPVFILLPFKYHMQARYVRISSSSQASARNARYPLNVS